MLRELTAVENVAGRFPDVRQNDIVLSVPLPVKEEVSQCYNKKNEPNAVSLHKQNHNDYLNNLASPTPS